MRKLLEKFGIIYILHGISMLHHRQIRPFVLAPLLINILIFALATWYVWNRGSELSEYLEFELPDWLAFIRFLVIPVLLVAFMVISYYVFALLAGIIAAPFNGILAAKAEEVIRGQTMMDEPVSETVKDIPRILLHTLRVLLYTLPKMLLSFLLLLIPLVGQLLWLLCSGWLTSVGYLDCAGDNHHRSLRDLLHTMRSRRSTCIGFGMAIYFMMMIPVLNLFVIPVAVCGATRLLTDLDGGAIRGPKELFGTGDLPEDGTGSLPEDSPEKGDPTAVPGPEGSPS